MKYSNFAFYPLQHVDNQQLIEPYKDKVLENNTLQENSITNYLR